LEMCQKVPKSLKIDVLMIYQKLNYWRDRSES